MFSHDHRLNLRVTHLTSFDGVKPSFMEWSEEHHWIFGSHRHYEELTTALISRSFIKGTSLRKVRHFQRSPVRPHGKHQEGNQEDQGSSWQIEIWRSQISRQNLPHSKTIGACAMTTKFHRNKIFTFKFLLSWRFPWQIAFGTIFPPAHPTHSPPWKVQFSFLLSSRFLWDKLEQKKSNMLKADFCLRYTLLHVQLLAIQIHHGQTDHADFKPRFRRLFLDWRFGVKWHVSRQDQQEPGWYHCPSRSWVAAARNVNKSQYVLQQCYHWLELISKYEALNGEKVTNTVKINFSTSKCQRQSCSISECQCQWLHNMVSGSGVAHQLLQQCSSIKTHLSSLSIHNNEWQERGRSTMSRKAKENVKI